MRKRWQAFYTLMRLPSLILSPGRGQIQGLGDDLETLTPSPPLPHTQEPSDLRWGVPLRQMG